MVCSNWMAYFKLETRRRNEFQWHWIDFERARKELHLRVRIEQIVRLFVQIENEVSDNCNENRRYYSVGSWHFDESKLAHFCHLFNFSIPFDVHGSCISIIWCSYWKAFNISFCRFLFLPSYSLNSMKLSKSVINFRIFGLWQTIIDT